MELKNLSNIRTLEPLEGITIESLTIDNVPDKWNLLFILEGASTPLTYHLKKLKINKYPVGSFEYFTGLEVESLTLTNCEMNSLKNIKYLHTSLKYLDLSNNNITDTKKINEKLKLLEYLDLSNNKIT